MFVCFAQKKKKESRNVEWTGAFRGFPVWGGTSSLKISDAKKNEYNISTSQKIKKRSSIFSKPFCRLCQV